jgi:glycolate oxidase FAD binding subunit
MTSILSRVEALVGAGAVQAWDSLAAERQAAIAQALVPGATPPSCVVFPETQAALGEVMALCDRDRLSVLPAGNFSKIGWGGLASKIDLVVSLAKLDRLVDHAAGDLTVTAEAGMPLAKLQSILAEANQFLALDPLLADRATLGGLIATNDSGPLRQRYGSLRDVLLGLDVIRYDGQRAKAGGRVVKNVAGYDLMKLFTGSFGSLGLIGQVTLRVYPRLAEFGSVVLTGEMAGLERLATATLASSLTPIAFEWLAGSIAQELAGAPIALLARFGGIPASIAVQSRSLLDLAAAAQVTGRLVSGEAEAELWQALGRSLDAGFAPGRMTIKLGILPNQIGRLLAQLALTKTAFITMRVSTGVGLLCADRPISALEQLRSFCNERSGYLMLLTADADLKQQFDVWGTVGTAIEPMRRIKAQFDPHNQLSPGRFVGNI